MTDQVTVTCPKCGKQYRVSPERIGKKGRCPCGNVFAVDRPQAAEDDRAHAVAAESQAIASSLDPLPTAGQVSLRSAEFSRVREAEGRRVMYAGRNGEVMRPEEAALAYYGEHGYQGVWSENHFWWQVMCLLFWDVIFARIEGVYTPGFGDFPSKLQDMPQDMFTGEFYRRREAIIRNRMKALHEVPSVGDVIAIAWREHRNKPCRPIEDWGRYSFEELKHGSEALTTAQLLQIMDRLLHDFNNNRSGMPDLFFFAPTPVFVEVKSESDSLRENQVEWQQFLSQSVGAPVELLLINHSERKVMSARRKVCPTTSGTAVTVSFGWSSSKKRDDAVAFAKSLQSYSCAGEGKEAIHTVTIDTTDVADLYKMLDLTTRWKSQQIAVDGERVKSGDIRSSLWCFRRKTDENAGPDYCQTHEHEESRRNLFGCRHVEFRELEEGYWTEYGHVDVRAQKGEWIFNKAAVRAVVEAQIEAMRLCPCLDVDKVRKKLSAAVNKLPDRVDPQHDTSWAFLDDSGRQWVYDKGEWQSEWGDDEWLGFARMVGVQKLSAGDRRKVRDRAELLSHADSARAAPPVARTKPTASTGTGCLLPWLLAFVGMVAATYLAAVALLGLAGAS